MLSDEKMSNGYPFSLLNDEQMSNKVGVEHQPDNINMHVIDKGSDGHTHTHTHHCI